MRLREPVEFFGITKQGGVLNEGRAASPMPFPVAMALLVAMALPPSVSASASISRMDSLNPTVSNSLSIF